MAWLTYNHAYRYLNNIPLDIIEITGTQMVLVMKLSLFAWAAYDGQRPAGELDSIQLKDRLVKVPGLLDFLGYAFYFPSVMTGPTFSYASYAAYVDGSLFGAQPRSGPLQLPPGRRRKAFKRVGIAAFYLAIYAVFGGKFSYERLLSLGHKSWLWKWVLSHRSAYRPTDAAKAGLHTASWIPRTNEILRRVVVCVSDGCENQRVIILSVLISESAMIVSGLGYDPSTRKWNRGRNVMIRQIE